MLNCLILELTWWGAFFAFASELRASKTEINSEQNCADLTVPMWVEPIEVIIILNSTNSANLIR